MRSRRAAARFFTPALAAPIGLAACLLLGCVSLRRPDDVAMDLYSAAWQRDVATGEGIAAPGVYEVISSALPASYTLDECTADIGGGVRCAFMPRGCDGGATMTMHLVEAPKGTYRITSAAVVGVFRSVNDPNLGTIVVLAPCGLVGNYREELTPFLTSELYSSALVPWSHRGPPRTRADTALAMSRLDTDREAIAEAVAALGQALAIGQDTTSVVATAVVEAGVTMGLGVAPLAELVHRQRPGLRPLWSHGAQAYPTDTTLLRRGIQFLDFAARLPHAVDWSDVLALDRDGHGLLDVRTASVAALDEMNGIAHYQLGRAYLDRATQTRTCALWTAAHDVLATGHASLARMPAVALADPSDARLAASSSQLAQRADSARLQSCRSP
jgi:hypothetical protein